MEGCLTDALHVFVLVVVVVENIPENWGYTEFVGSVLLHIVIVG